MKSRFSFGQWLRQRCKSLRLKQEALAECAGYSVSYIQKIEADDRSPSEDLAERLGNCLGIPADELAMFVEFATGQRHPDALRNSATEPWGTPYHPRNNLPLPPTQLIGREQVMVQLEKRLLQENTHLLTLIGPPGVGKTRLAIEIAQSTLDHFLDGVFFVDLSLLKDSDAVIPTVATALGLKQGARQPLDALKILLQDQQTLLVLDNFEHVLAAAPMVEMLLRTCFELKILVTSRAPLRLRRERQFAVLPLALPDPSEVLNLDNLAEYSAISLFIDRAQAVQSDFVMTQKNASIVRTICSRLDGLPLAIELVSARIKLTPLQTLLAQLQETSLLQARGPLDLPFRQHTLDAHLPGVTNCSQKMNNPCCAEQEHL